jgi:MbtH protein
MSTQDWEDNTTYKVVVNHEDHYSIWPTDRENVPGWRDAGKQGSKQSAAITSRACGQTCGR